MRLVFRLVVVAFALAYVAALAVFAIGTWGWFGQAPDPLSGIFLIPLGLPWNLAIPVLPEPAWPVLGAIAPTLNLLILLGIGRWLR